MDVARPRTLVLCDASLPGLVACAMASEERALANGRADVGVLGFPFTPEAEASVRAIAEQYGLGQPLPRLAGGATLPVEGGEREVYELLAATYAGVRAGFDRILWPATAGVSDGVDIDRIAQIADRALLVGRLVAVDAAAHACPSIHIETPLADFTDRQLADLALDMEVPVEACWWWRNDAGIPERRRWSNALHSMGWRGRGSPAPTTGA